MISAVNDSEADTQTQLLSTADSLDEMSNMASGIKDLNYNSWADSLIGLASQYDNCSDEIEDYKSALSSGNKE
jgi:hypothetical protein